MIGSDEQQTWQIVVGSLRPATAIDWAIAIYSPMPHCAGDSKALGA
jgi:hypothetical protein